MDFLIIIFLQNLFISFILFFGYYIFMKIRKKLVQNKALKIIVKKYDLDMDDRKIKILSRIMVIVNTLILAIPLTVAYLISNYIILVIVSFVIIVILILLFYNLIGYVLKKKGW